MVVKSPLEITNTVDQFDVIINVQGGGYTGQSGAMRHGITRALMEASEDYRPVLKAAGFVTRDPRAKERKNTVLKQLVVLHNSLNVNYIYVQEISRSWMYSMVFFVYSTELNIFLSLYISFDSKAIYDKSIVYIFCLGRRRWEHMIIVLS